MSTQVTVSQAKCLKCGHEWFPRTAKKPRLCPKCKSARWNVGRNAPRKTRSDAGVPRKRND